MALQSHNYKMIIKSALNFITKKLNKHIIRTFTQQNAQTVYAQRPFLSQKWLTQKATLKDAIHNSWLMAKGVIPFSYDGYEWACSKAITNQAQLSKQDMFMLIGLGIQYRVRLSPFCNHVENEIFLRIHRDYELDMQDYDQQIKAELKVMYGKLQAKSKDYFNLLNDQTKEEEQPSEDQVQESKTAQNIPQVRNKMQQQSETQQLIKQLSDKLRDRKQKEFTVQDLLKVSQYLRQWNSRNLQMIQYLQQLLTIKLQTQKVEAQTALSYLQFLTYACQALKIQYDQNKQKYTVRSIKRIYKYQFLYFHEHFRQLITSDATATPYFVEEVIKQYAAFPIKRREIRKKIGIYVGSQMQKFNMLERNDLSNLLLDLNGKDQKMKKSYRQLLHLPEPKPYKKETAEQFENTQEIGLQAQQAIKSEK